MKLPLIIGLRYLFSKKKVNAINIITRIAIVGFGVGAFAMIVVLSAFNGFENIVGGLMNSFDPNLKINHKTEKFFKIDESVLSKISKIPGVSNVAFSLEEKVVIKNDDRQEIGIIKGLSANFPTQSIDSLILMGDFDLGDTAKSKFVFGGGLANKLSVFPGALSPISIYVPRRGASFNAMNPADALSLKYGTVSGIFVAHEDIDLKYLLTNIGFVQGLLEYPGGSSAIEIHLTSTADIPAVKANIATIMGDKWQIKTREELNELVFKVFKSERWFTFAMLAFVMLISSFNIFGSLIMVILDKKRDIALLQSMGMTRKNIQWVFLFQGTMVAIIGGAIGLILGSVLIILQDHFGLIQLQNSIVDAYPVELRWTDVLLTLSTFTFLGLAMSFYPAVKAGKLHNTKLN